MPVIAITLDQANLCMPYFLPFFFRELRGFKFISFSYHLFNSSFCFSRSANYFSSSIMCFSTNSCSCSVVSCKFLSRLVSLSCNWTYPNMIEPNTINICSRNLKFKVSENESPPTTSVANDLVPLL